MHRYWACQCRNRGGDWQSIIKANLFDQTAGQKLTQSQSGELTFDISIEVALRNHERREAPDFL